MAGQPSLQLRVFKEKIPVIHTAILNSVVTLAREACSQGLILEETKRELSAHHLTDDARADVFIQALQYSIGSDHTRLMKFVDVLRKSDSKYYSTLIETLSTFCWPISSSCIHA